MNATIRDLKLLNDAFEKVYFITVIMIYTIGKNVIQQYPIC